MLRDNARHLKRNQKGQAYLEFAVIVPIMVFVIMGLVDFGRVFNTWIVMTHGAREGARVAAVGYDDTQVTARVDSVTAGHTITVEVLPLMAGGGGARTGGGDPVTVTVSSDVTGLPVFSFFLGSSTFTVSAQGVSRYEGPCVSC